MKKKKMKRTWAMMMAVSLVMGIPSAFQGITAKASGAEQELKVNQFATKEQLLSSFDLSDETEQKTAQKVYFGQNTSDAQTWYIAGQDINGGLVLMCDLTKPLKEDQIFENYPEEWVFAIEKAYDPNSNCVYSSQDPKNVYVSHYGSSELRKVLQKLETDSSYFSSGEQALMQKTTITTRDEYNDATYTTTDKLYVAHGDDKKDTYITVGADSGKTLESGVKIGVETGLYVPEGWAPFWLRSPYPGPGYDDGGEHGKYATAIYDGGEYPNMAYHDVKNENKVVPAFNFDVSSVLFASAVPAVSSEGKSAIDDALTFRYESAALGSAVVSEAAGRISISNVPEQTYLVVQNSSGAWAKQVSQDGELSPQDISPDISTFEGCKVWLESTDKDRITTAAMADWQWDVKITPGSHMTKTTDSGAETQTGLSGGMTDVVYTANSGYYFPEDYPAAEQNGISVRRDDFTRITISGTPTGNANITLVEAAAKEEQEEPQVSGGVMKINGTTAAMEYAGSKTAAVWDECTDDYTAVQAGTWYVRYKETDTRRASQASEVEVSVPDYAIIASKNALDFGAVNMDGEENYIQPDIQTVTIENTGNSAVTLNQPVSTSGSYSVGGLTESILEPGEKAEFTVQPNADLKAGAYTETIEITTEQGTGANVNISFKVNEAFSVAINPASAGIVAGQSQTLAAEPEGGSGSYSYAWYEENKEEAFADSREISISPQVTTIYKVAVTDGIETKEAEIEVIVAPRVIEGANGKWTKSSKNGLSFRSDADFREFLKVTVDGQEIRESDYTVREGSTIVTLKPEYLETLDAGKHTLGIVSAGGIAETTFTIETKAAPADEKKPTADQHNPTATDNGTAVPQTGDGGNLFLWFASFLLAVGGIIIAIVRRRKINSRQQV